MEWLKEFVKSIIAGIMISIGCIVNLSCDNKYIGALLFCVGLITILMYQWNLYTGKVCYIPYNNKKYIAMVVAILIGNILGCSIIGMSPQVTPTSICLTKLSYDLKTILFKSIMCGMLIYISVESYIRHKTFIPTLFCIPVFILSGYIHVVADSFYFVNARVINEQVIWYILIAAIGNAIGGACIPLIYNTKLMK